MITIIQVRNPLDPTRDREVSEIEARGRTLEDIFGEEDRSTPLHVSVNGHLWERSLWPEVTPVDGDSIVIAAQVRGGSILKTLASIAVLAAAAAVTAGFGAAFAGVIGVSTGVGSSLLAGIVSIAGNLLISAFMGPASPSQKTDTATYDPDGPKSLARSGTVIAKGFGTMLFGGNIVSSFVDVEGQDQYLNVLMCAGFGPARAIHNIQINGKDVSSYQNVQVTLRYGANDQLPIPGFNRVVNGYPQATKCLAGQPVVVPGTGTFTEELQVDIQFPEGIFYLDNGNLTGLGITYLVEYALSGTNNWQAPLIPYETVDLVSYDYNGLPINPPFWVVLASDFPASGGICYASSRSPHTPGEPWTGTIPCDIYVPGGSETTVNLPRSGTWQPFVPGTNLVQVTHWRQGYQSFVDSSNQALYNRTTIVGLAPGKYDVRVTKYGSNRTRHTISFGDNNSPLVGQSMWVHSVNEIQFNDLAYPNMILIGVRALATNQLSGQNINITAEIDFGLRSRDEGLMPVELMAFGEDNPACVAADMMLDTLYGGGGFPGIVPANIERYIDEWVAWAEMNDEPVAGGTSTVTGSSPVATLGSFETLHDWLQPGDVGNDGGGTGGAFPGVATFTPGPTATLHIAANGPYDDAYFYRPIVTTYDSVTDFTYRLDVLFPTQADLDACQAFEFELQQSVGGRIANMAIQRDFKGAQPAWNTFTYTPPKSWDHTSIPVSASDFVAGQWTSLVAVFHRDPDANTLTHVSLSINGTVYPIGVTRAMTVQAESDYVNAAIQLDSNGLQPPTAYNVQVRNVGVTLGVPLLSGGTVKRHVFNGVFDNESDLWSQLREVGQMSRAQLVPIGRDYGVFIDQAVDAPVQMFTVGNILEDSFSETFLNLDDRANQVEIQFADRTRSYRSDSPLVFMSQGAQDSGRPIKNTRIAARGVTVPAQAWHLARFKVRSNDLLLRTGSIRCDTDAIACKYGSVVMLQHDVPSWGWGGRTLPGSTASRVLVDRFDLDHIAGTPYSLVVRHPSIARFTGAVAFAVTSTSPPGVSISVTGWPGVDRITRAVIGGSDCAVLVSYPGGVTVSPPPGFVPAQGQAVTLFDTDVLETAAVLAVDIAAAAITLAAPLSRVPEDYSTYIYGEAGGVKLVRVTGVKRSSEFRSTIEWIDYDPNLYTDAIPALGGTGIIPPTRADVTSLTGVESFQLVGGSYVGYASLSWRPGPDTVGVSVYALPQDHTGLTRLIAQFAGQTSFLVEQPPGTSVTYTVVGYDAKGINAPHTSAPFVTVNTVGPATNLLRGSNFASGFTYWSVTSRTGDTFAPTLDNDGQAVYTVLSSAIAAPVTFAYQQIDPAKWSVGETLILSGYVMDAAISQYQPNAGSATMMLAFIKADGTSSSVTPALPLNGVRPSLYRSATAPVVIPAGTVAITVSFGIGGAPIDVPAGATVTWSHLLLEIAHPGQLLPSPWADIDVQGHVQEVFTGGSSTSLRSQGSLLPTFTGLVQYASTDTTITISWTGLVVLWPDGSYTQIQAGSLSWSALNATTDYWAWLFYDIQLGAVFAAIPVTPIGSPASLSAAYDGNAEAACKQDGRVALTLGGFKMTTAAAATGGTGGGPGGGTAPNPSPVRDCTVRGTVLEAAEGPLSNVEIEARFARGEEVYLQARGGPERIRNAWWVRVPHWYLVSIEGLAPFGASESFTLKPAGGEHRWCSRIASGTAVETAAGFAPVTLRRVDLPADVLHIELDGPSHEYQVEGGGWTHNWLKAEPPADSGY